MNTTIYKNQPCCDACCKPACSCCPTVVGPTGPTGPTGSHRPHRSGCWRYRPYRSYGSYGRYRRNRSYRTYGCHRRSRNGSARRIGDQWHYGAVHQYCPHRLDHEQRCFGWASHRRRSGAQRFISGATGIRCANEPDPRSCPRQLLQAFLLCPRGRGSTGSDWQDHLYRRSRRRIKCG